MKIDKEIVRMILQVLWIIVYATGIYAGIYFIFGKIIFYIIIPTLFLIRASLAIINHHDQIHFKTIVKDLSEIVPSEIEAFLGLLMWFSGMMLYPCYFVYKKIICRF